MYNIKDDKTPWPSRKLGRAVAGIACRAVANDLLWSKTGATYFLKRVYSIIEYLVLWARSEKIGYAVTLPIGMMEYWSIGIMGLAE